MIAFDASIQDPHLVLE